MTGIIRSPSLPSALKHKLAHPFAQISETLSSEAETLSARLFSELVAKHPCASGQQFRARLAWGAARSLDLDDRTGMALACCCEWLHDASLIHDDIQDGDRVRRDRPALWIATGLGPAICLGDALISAAYSVLRETEISTDRLKSLMGLVEDAIRNTVTGQLEDLEARQTPIGVLTAYESIAAAKAGPLLSLPLTLAIAAGGPLDEQKNLIASARSAMTDLGVAYQLLDDLRDWRKDRRTDGQHLANAVLIELQHLASSEAAAQVSERARQRLAAAERCALGLPVGLNGLVAWLAAEIAGQLNVG